MAGKRARCRSAAIGESGRRSGPSVRTLQDGLRGRRLSEFGQVFGDEVSPSILDRRLHHCDVVPINGPSYRLKNRLTAIEGEAGVA
ncbi:ATP-binding protein [Streptomyces sp. NBC_00647]